MRLFLFSLLLCSGALAAQNPVATAPSEVKITNHTNKPGLKAGFGQTVSIQVYTYLGDSLFMSTRRDYGGAHEIALPTKEQFEAETQAPAFLTAIFSMAEGDSATIIEPIPEELRVQMPEGFKTIPAVRYEAVLVDIVSLEEMQKREAEFEKMMEATIARGAIVATEVQTALAGYKAGTLGKNLQKSASGLEYIILEQGTGAPINMGDEINTHYYGVLTADGQMFDNSFDRGEPTPFPVGQLIPGFNEGMQLLNRGGKAILFIPPVLGYGEAGAGDAIPANADLVFYIEMGL